MLVLHRDMCWLECPFEGLKSCPRVAVATASSAIKLYRRMHHGRMNCKMACCDQRVNAYSSTHDVIVDTIDERICRFRFRKMHARVLNRLQSCVEDKFLIEKVRSTSMKRCDNMPVSVRSRKQVLYSRSSGRIPRF